MTAKTIMSNSQIVYPRTLPGTGRSNEQDFFSRHKITCCGNQMHTSANNVSRQRHFDCCCHLSRIIQHLQPRVLPRKNAELVEENKKLTKDIKTISAKLVLRWHQGRHFVTSHGQVFHLSKNCYAVCFRASDRSQQNFGCPKQYSMTMNQQY